MRACVICQIFHHQFTIEKRRPEVLILYTTIYCAKIQTLETGRKGLRVKVWVHSLEFHILPHSLVRKMGGDNAWAPLIRPAQIPGPGSTFVL